ncbi:MAG: hypothetical protein RMK84_09470 [Oscillochloridaceae bacterium]|nr:hypothetical protein [Oscillochloridaceae bacterium]
MAARPLRRLAALLGGVALALALLLGGLPALRAQSDVRFFPETQHSLRGAFRVFWEANGGVEIFGFPITEEFTGPNGRITQWFERARFELAQGGSTPVVELGNLGVEFTQGRIFPKSPPIPNTADRRYIPQTQTIIQYGFKEIWETRGAERIFGFPISNEIQEQLESGRWHTVQYFEKARFEYWPEFPPGRRVLISNLGRRLAPPALQVPAPPPGPPTPPAPSPTPLPPLPPGINGRVTPEIGPPGATFLFVASGFAPGERVGIWVTAPNQATFSVGFQATADNRGTIEGENITFTADRNALEGIWSFNARGISSRREAIGYFRVSRVTPAGDPDRLGRVAHDQLGRQGDGFIVPVAAPPGTNFTFLARGFQSGEEVSAWITGPAGRSAPINPAQVRRDGTTAQVSVTTSGLAEGVYTAVARGQRSGVTVAAAFSLTRDFVAGPGTPLPGNNRGSAAPANVQPGGVVQIRGEGLRPGEPLEFWITDPSGAYVLFPETPVADDQGRIGYNPPRDLQIQPNSLPGVYGVHFRGKASGARVDIYFSVTLATRAAPDPEGMNRQFRALAGAVVPAR